MELYEAMRTTSAVREFTDDPLPDSVLFNILDNARFAPSGGNRQGGRVLIIRSQQTKQALAELATPGARRYVAQLMAKENPWNSVTPTSVDAAAINQTEVPSLFVAPLIKAPVVLVVCLDLSLVASTDMNLSRIGVISGASIYPLVWNILLSARNEGYGGTITTLAVSEEPKIKTLLGIPDNYAICALVPLGKPVKQLTRLRRNSVPEFTMLECWKGEPLKSS